MASSGNGEQVLANPELDTAEAIESMWASSVAQIGEIDSGAMDQPINQSINQSFLLQSWNVRMLPA
jgi:hypothetical protein